LIFSCQLFVCSITSSVFVCFCLSLSSLPVQWTVHRRLLDEVLTQVVGLMVEQLIDDEANQFMRGVAASEEMVLHYDNMLMVSSLF
jgi:hypothetical protein